mmetsp:Transcript_6529/g.10351  ORF Transcript_6529/g.10351 Transcript_6529/m.10351 type:complete len:101 (-) Transcript_6529:99-401(-)
MVAFQLQQVLSTIYRCRQVNTGSRMASSARPCDSSSPYIHLTDSTWSEISPECRDQVQIHTPLTFQARTVEIKGKGTMEIYCLRPETEVVDNARLDDEVA